MNVLVTALSQQSGLTLTVSRSERTNINNKTVNQLH